ncbi:hypothetical protein L1987_55142 [Smallanthus sonchifolius]|uniref:Uncharacterized protein n=1 Tax=Smallanthus sonchifolius TaxID=185202 RepID=A0ACB9E9I8_9ASTR|nr:hypothetical protein L1987_87143 [Smallanthus sonchifolius]KAI3755345.1 hypothetical protein L1987_55142 [Smallanthus sonchifolius]
MESSRRPLAAEKWQDVEEIESREDRRKPPPKFGGLQPGAYNEMGQKIKKGGMSFKDMLINKSNATQDCLTIDMYPDISAFQNLHNRALMGRAVDLASLRALKGLVMAEDERPDKSGETEETHGEEEAMHERAESNYEGKKVKKNLSFFKKRLLLAKEKIKKGNYRSKTEEVYKNLSLSAESNRLKKRPRSDDPFGLNKLLGIQSESS